MRKFWMVAIIFWQVATFSWQVAIIFLHGRNNFFRSRNNFLEGRNNFLEGRNNFFFVVAIIFWRGRNNYFYGRNNFLDTYKYYSFIRKTSDFQYFFSFSLDLFELLFLLKRFLVSIFSSTFVISVKLTENNSWIKRKILLVRIEISISFRSNCNINNFN